MAHQNDKQSADHKQAPAKDKDLAAEAGRKGGQSSHKAADQHHQSEVGSGKQHDSNNFANDRKKASEAGKKGGQHS